MKKAKKIVVDSLVTDAICILTQSPASADGARAVVLHP